MAISALITVGYNLYKAYRKANPTLGELREQMDDLSASCSELNQQLETNYTRIRELQSLESRTLIEDEELRKLREENALLAQQLAIEEGLKKAKQDQYVDTFLEKYHYTTTNPYTYKDEYGVTRSDFEGDIEALDRKADELRLLKKEISTKTSELSSMSPDDKGYSKTKKELDDLKAEYSALAQEVGDSLETIESDVSRLPDDVTGVAKDLKDAFELVKVSVASTLGADAQTTVIGLYNSAKFADVKDQLDTMYRLGELTGEKLHGLWAGMEDNDPLKQLIGLLLELNAISGVTPESMQQIIDAIFGVETAASDAILSMSPLAKMTDGIKDGIDALASAQKDMNEMGTLSLESISALASNAGLKEYLVQTADGYKLATDAVEDYLDVHDAQYRNTFNEAKQAAVERINQANRETAAIDESTESIKKKLLWSIQEQKQADLRAKAAQLSKGSVHRYSEAELRLMGYLDESDLVSSMRESYNQLLEAEKMLDVWTSVKGSVYASYLDGSTSSSSDDPLKDDIEKQIKILKHQREMNEITDEQYYDGLRIQMERYYVDAAKYEEEIWELREELYKGYQELLNDWINDQNKAAERFARAGNVTDQLAVYKGIIAKVQSAIDQAYADGLDANSDYVQSLEDQMQEAAQRILDITKSVFDDFISYADDFNRWDNIGEDLDISKIEMLRAKLKSIQKLLDDGTISWEDYLDAYNEAAKSLYDTQKESIETIIDLTMELIEQEAEDEIEALEKQADAYDELIEKKKELLEKADDEADHEKKVAEAVREIAKLQSKISQLSLDDSREAAAQKAKLEEELYQKQLELADLQGDYALEQTLETLDKAQEANKETVDAEKEAIEKSIDTWVKKYEQAIDRIDNDWDGLYKDLLDYQEEYRDSIDGIDSFETAWRNVEDTIIDVNENIADSISSTIKGIEDIYQAIENVGVNPGTPNLDDDGAWDGTVSGGASSATSSKYSSLVSEKGRSIVQKMYNNSVKAASNPSLRDTLNQQNHDLAADYYWQTGDELYYNAPSGTWHIGDSYSDPFLYEVYGLKKYHTGGYVGNEGAINDREVLSVLEKGELVLTKGHQFNLKKILSDMYAMVKAMTSINLPSFSTSATSPNGNFNANVEVNITHNGSMTDDDAKRYGSIAGDAALKKLYAAFNKRGIR